MLADVSVTSAILRNTWARLIIAGNGPRENSDYACSDLLVSGRKVRRRICSRHPVLHDFNSGSEIKYVFSSKSKNTVLTAIAIIGWESQIKR